MTPRKVFIFILSVFATITCLSFLIPEEGLVITLDFPTPQELLGSIMREKEEEPEAPDEQELLARAERAARDSAERERLLAYLEEDPARIQFPGGDYALFDSVFEAFEQSDSTTVRIMYYGDSQIEEDRMSSTLRELLQERFGGQGPGMLPFMKSYTATTSSWVSGSMNNYSAYYFGGGSRSDGLYGPAGRSSRLNADCRFGAGAATSNTGHSARFKRLTVLGAPPKKDFRIKVGDSTIVARPDPWGRAVRFWEFELPDSSSSAQVSIGAGAEIFGIQLDGDHGICVDNAAMRGCSGTIFTRIDEKTLSDYYELAGVRLIIFQYGGNMVPGCTGRKGVSHFKSLIVRELEYLAEAAPAARILFIGPSDMSTNIRGSMETFPQLPMMVDSLRAAAHECGAAYWDLYAAMGGKGSMTRWVRSSPPLAGGDYIHFTRKGAETATRILYNSLMVSYDYYRLRKEGKE